LKKITGQEQTDEQLMQRQSLGDKQAFEMLYDRYFDKLVWFARGFLSDAQKSEDVVQEIFIRIIEKPNRFDPNRKFSTWIYTATGNACKNILRNEKNQSRILDENRFERSRPEAENEEENDPALLRKIIEEACSHLNEREKQLYILRFEEELSIKEIATVLQIPDGSVKSGIYYMLKKLSIKIKAFNYEN